MKKVLVTGMIISLAVFCSMSVKAQDSTTAGQDIKNAAKKTGKAVEKAATKVGEKTAEIASKGKATLVDQVYKGKQGPGGQTIYINNESEYYWIDKKGHKNFVTTNDLKDKP